MATINFLNVDPISGNGNKTVAVMANANTGRGIRSCSIFVKGGGITKEVYVGQSGADAFAKKDADLSIEYNAGKCIATGTSNCNSLEYSVYDGQFISNLRLKVNGEYVASGQQIAGDPGYTAAYKWAIEFDCSNNNTSEARTGTIWLKGEGINGGIYIFVRQKPNEANQLNVSTTSLSIDSNGAPTYFDITSNIDWTIESL